mgnify:CR=1 FL=1
MNPNYEPDLHGQYRFCHNPYYCFVWQTPCSDSALNALAIDEPLEYARLYLDGNLQMWVDAEDSLEL